MYIKMTNFKILIMGSRGSGKTMAVKKAVLKVTDNKYVPTITGKLYKYTNTKNNELDIWDIGGTDPIPGISDGYCNNVNYLILFGINQQPYINTVKNFSPNVIIINYTNQVNFQNFLDSL
jgi:GTPase SAR1 family protein